MDNTVDDTHKTPQQLIIEAKALEWLLSRLNEDQKAEFESKWATRKGRNTLVNEFREQEEGMHSPRKPDDGHIRGGINYAGGEESRNPRNERPKPGRFK